MDKKNRRHKGEDKGGKRKIGENEKDNVHEKRGTS